MNELFSRCIIVYSIGFVTYVVLRVLSIAETEGINCYNIINATVAFFGGELLLLMLKRVFKDKSDTDIKIEQTKQQSMSINDDQDCD